MAYTLFNDQSHLMDCGKYRTHAEPMQIVSHRYDSPRVFFEAPPSTRVPDEMATFVDWFNSTRQSESILGRAAIAIKKSKILTALSGQLNQRQEKVLLRIFAEGLEGFKGGLRAENIWQSQKLLEQRQPVI